jgi:Kelch motif
MGYRGGLLVAVLSVAACTVSPGVGSADTWFPAAPMSEPRAAQTATLLPGGGVLVAGGYNGFIENVGGRHTNLDLAEVFQPATNTWTQVAPMLVARSFQSATSLQDGRVLVIGGWETPEASCISGDGRTAEMYNPASNAWSAIPTPKELQSVDAAILLPSGLVFLTGEFGPPCGEDTQGAALYDPASNMWEEAANPKHPRSGATLALLADGDVLMLGGSTSEHRFPPVETIYTVLPTVEQYDPSTDQWTEVAPMIQPRSYETATVMPEGNVLVTGGVDQINNGPLSYSGVNTTEMYDPATNSWGAVAPMAIAREGHTATLLPDGTVLVAGGGDCSTLPSVSACLGYGSPPVSGDCCAASSAELYDPATNTWSFASPVTSGVEHTATLMPEGAVLVTGGNFEPVNTHELSTVEIYTNYYPPDEPSTATPISATPAGAAVTASPLAPEIESATESNRIWREGDKLASVAGRRQRTPLGTQFLVRLNEPASLRLTFVQVLTGRQVRGRCVAETTKNHRAHTCKRERTGGALTFPGQAGGDTITFQGRISRAATLSPGSYTVKVTASNAAGHSAARRLAFTIAK